MTRENEFPRTWLWLLGKLQGLTLEQLKQPIQVFGPDICDGKVHLLKPAVSLGTVEELLHVGGEVGYETRGPDFAHHPEQVILSIDHAPFSAEGDTSFLMEDGGMRGDVTGKLFPFGSKEAVKAEPESWETYGRMAYVRWRTETDPTTRDEALAEWGRLSPKARTTWEGVAKSSALMAYPDLARKGT